ncbi:hypothetical protein Q31b_49230 [Novipirellula aureliae]|uniref:Uncharacterized protein n=1 Tax=Novipirellula aureliae TaxID=2527966 RepID=A0A5C6DJ74_9BACT|nr:hypothetical protein [Novipirellula aureliae]TWU36642.1 hypothetical protein Q31b_49230 [Novipirellula aureliae]
MNPYDSPLAPSEDSISDDDHAVGLRRLINRPAFAIAWIFASTLFGIGFILLMHSISPIPPIDFTFYLRLYAAIGAVAGLLSWYTAYLVALKRILFGSLLVALMLPYGFVTLLALAANPVVAILATIIFGGALTMAYLVRPV